MINIFNIGSPHYTYLAIHNKAYASDNTESKTFLDYYASGLEFKINGQYDNAIKDFTMAIIRDGSSYLPYAHRGDIYFMLKRYGEAIKDYDKAISLEPYNSELYVRRGTSLSYINKYYSAMKDYDKAITLDRSNSSAYQQRSILYAQLEDRRKSINDIEKALELEKNCHSYLSAAFVYNTLHDYKKSVWYYERALAIAPKNRVVDIQKWLNEEKENCEAAIAITSANDESPLAYYSAALMNNSYGNYDKAYEYSLKALKLDAKYYAAHYCLGTALIGLHQYDNALKVLNKGLSGTKEKWLIGVLHRERGRIYLHKKDYHKAIDDFNKAIMYNESSEEYYYRGEAYRYMQEYNKAYADYQKAISLKGWSYKPYYALEEIAPYVTIK